MPKVQWFHHLYTAAHVHSKYHTCQCPLRHHTYCVQVRSVHNISCPSQFITCPDHVQSEYYLSCSFPISAPYLLPSSSQNTTSLAQVQPVHHLFWPLPVGIPPLLLVSTPSLLPISSQFTMPPTPPNMSSQYTISIAKPQLVHNLTCASPVSIPSLLPMPNLFFKNLISYYIITVIYTVWLPRAWLAQCLMTLSEWDQSLLHIPNICPWILTLLSLRSNLICIYHHLSCSKFPLKHLRCLTY